MQLDRSARLIGVINLRMNRFSELSRILFLLLFLLHGLEVDTKVQDRDYWYERARNDLEQRLEVNGESFSAARNVILFIGDGMGVSTVTAARVLRGQRAGSLGEEENLAWDQFSTVGMAKTYNSNAQIGESSACATALLCGVKTNYETVGVDATASFNNCISTYQASVPSLAAWAQQEGKATGLVTNTRVTHATPAALYAHSASRFWEDDGKMSPPARKSCKDIARQLFEDEPGRNLNVILGGGRRHFLSKVSATASGANEGRRLDGRNLIDDWLRDKKHRDLNAEFVTTRQQLRAIDTRFVDHLLGLFADSHLDFEADRDRSQQPSLAEMTRVALNILQRGAHGFLLVVEGGRIDHAHHNNNAYRALDEALALEEAVSVVLSEVDLSETLVVVTADHGAVMTIGGVATPRGNPILGADERPSDIDYLPYSTILYGNGPGFTTGTGARRTNPAIGRDAIHSSAVPKRWASHGGEDVPVYAHGPGAAWLSGTYDQSYIAHALAYAACLGPYAHRCRQPIPNYPFDEDLANDAAAPSQLVSFRETTSQPSAATSSRAFALIAALVAWGTIFTL